MSKLPSSKEIIKTLRRNGFEYVSQRGSHIKYRKESNTVIVPHPKKEIPMGTFRSNVRQSGLEIRDF